jgi:fumarate hydratase class I
MEQEEYKRLRVPLTEEVVRGLRVGDKVLVSGTIHTARDMAHARLSETSPEGVPFQLSGAAIYHCGPIVIENDGGWEVIAAGPTTSARTEPYIASIIERHSPRVFIGKGGLGSASLDAFERFGCVYLSAVGGCAQSLADAISSVNEVFYLDEFGVPEAVWVLEVEDFPATVTMDAHGNSWHSKPPRGR